MKEVTREVRVKSVLNYQTRLLENLTVECNLKFKSGVLLILFSKTHTNCTLILYINTDESDDSQLLYNYSFIISP